MANKNEDENIIELSPSTRRKKTESVDEFSPAVSKKKRKRRRVNFAALTVIGVFLTAILVTYIIMVSIHPVGISEYFSCLYASFGSGEGYNVDISGGKPSYSVSDEGRYFIVTDNSVACYNTNGKTILERSHSYSDPVLKSGDTRYILYGQGEKELSVSTLTEVLYTNTFKYGIICAGISHSGGYAVATKTDGYDSSVSVFNKDNEKIYEWFSPKETINAVALSENGKSLMVSTVSVVDGKFVSNLYILGFDSADPIMKRSYSDEVVFSLLEIGNNGCCAVFEDKIEFLFYDKDNVVTHESEYQVSSIKRVGNRIIAARSVAANQDQSLVEIYDLDGKQISKYSVDSFVTDFSFRSGKLYILGLSKVYKYDLEGKLLGAAPVDYDAMYVEAVSDNEVACCRNSSIDKYKILPVEE